MEQDTTIDPVTPPDLSPEELVEAAEQEEAMSLYEKGLEPA